MARLNIDRQNALQPHRMDYACEKLKELGFALILNSDNKVSFNYNGSIVHFFPYSGWHTGKTIKDGRGIEKLLNQLKQK